MNGNSFINNTIFPHVFETFFTNFFINKYKITKFGKLAVNKDFSDVFVIFATQSSYQKKNYL